MLRTTAFAALCVILAAFGVFRLGDAYSTFASDTPDPSSSRHVIHQDLDPIGEADAYALAQAAPAAGGTTKEAPPIEAKPSAGELLKLLSGNGYAPRVVRVPLREVIAHP